VTIARPSLPSAMRFCRLDESGPWRRAALAITTAGSLVIEAESALAGSPPPGFQGRSEANITAASSRPPSRYGRVACVPRRPARRGEISSRERVSYEMLSHQNV